MFKDILFCIFSFSILLNSVGVVVSKNSVYSAFFLILCFVSAVAVLLLFECEFIAILFLLIYVGAIAILFLFVVMMLNNKTNKFLQDGFSYFPFGIFISFLLLGEILTVVYSQFSVNSYSGTFLSNFYENWFSKIDSLTEIEVIGQVLYHDYVVQFLMSGSILLLALISVVVLSFNYNNNIEKQQAAAKQNARRWA